MQEWSADVLWLGEHCRQDDLRPYMLSWATRMKEVISDVEKRGFANQHTELDDGEEEVILDVQVNDGEDVDGGAIVDAVEDTWEDVDE